MHALPYLTVPTTAAPLGAPALAMSLAAHPERWLPLVDYRAGARWYRLLERTEHHEVWLQSWLPGQGSEWHDHGRSSGAFAVAAGTLTECTVRPGPAEVTRQLAAGRVRAFGPHYVHRLVNSGTVPAVSVHVYPSAGALRSGDGAARRAVVPA